MLIYRNAERVHGQRKFDNTCPKPKPSPVATGSFGGLSPPNKALSAPKLKHETLQISGVFVNF